ncbi:MAG: tyrosine-type recombinase/integrase [Dokdonella sp.]|nr:tyrosine-type recombinase/integrase [Dokdonella sp.]
MKLTKGSIDRAKYDGTSNARAVLWDEEVSGLGLRVYPSGRKAFVLSYRHMGRKRLIALAAYGVLTLDEARTRARKMLAKVEEVDPLAVREKARMGETFNDLAREYIDRYAKPRKKTWAEDERRIAQHLTKPFGQRKVEGITRADVAALHRRIGQRTPIEANRMLALLSRMFTLAQRWGMIPDAAVNPARGVDRYRETKRDRWLTPAELPRLVQAMNAEPNEVARCAIWLYLLTGARRSELLGAKWEYIDFDRKVLRLPDTKAGRPHEIPLNAQALALIERIPRVEGNPYLLPGGKPGRPLVNIKGPWGRVRKAAGVEDVRLHDLRRTVGSWLAAAGYSLPLIGKVLNHSNVATTAIYARLGHEQARASLEQLGERMMAAAGIAPSATVTPIAEARKAKGSAA